jgi:hypothetical protein
MTIGGKNMGLPVLIIGQSGCGKSRSIKNMPPQATVIFNVEGKQFPFRTQFPYTMNTDDPERIKGQLMRLGPVKRVVIDDSGYLMTNMFMRGHSGGRKGSQVFDLYNDIGDSFWGLIKFIKDQLPPDVIVYIMMHEEDSDTGKIKPKTIGKMLDEKVCLEGMFTICLRGIVKDGQYLFSTRTNGIDPVKTPEDMFMDEYIENDLMIVDRAIRNYYGWEVQNNAETARI